MAAEVTSTNESFKDTIPWISQHDLPSPLNKISNHLCGVTCVAMVTHTSVQDVLKKIEQITVLPTIDQGKSVPINLWLKINLHADQLRIPLGPSLWRDQYPETAGFTTEEMRQQPESRRVTPFNMRGIDHNFTSQLFDSFGISGLKARKIGDLKTPLSSQDLENIVSSGEIVMASVANKVWMEKPDSKGSHVVLITAQTPTHYMVYDPDAESGPTQIEKMFFNSAFNGYGTAIKITA